MSQFPQIALNNKNGHSLITTTIASGTAVTPNIYASSVQESFQAQDYGFRGLAVASAGAWTAADLTIEVSLDGSTWLPVFAFGSIVRLVSIPTSGGFLAEFPSDGSWSPGTFPYVRLRSINTASTADANQGGTRTLTVVLMR